MIASTTLPLKILRTKKRLSNVIWYLPIIILACMGLMVLLSFMLRAISAAGIYGLVSAEIPVLSVPLEDPTYFTFREKPGARINEHTAMVILTPTHFYFGDVAAFTKDFPIVDNKFLVAHDDGAPQIEKLLTDMEKWFFMRENNQKVTSDGILIFLPTGDIPSPIVIQTLAGLQKSPLFQRVVLAGGLD